MATIHEIFAVGQNSMNAARLLATTSSENIANVNTPGYARRILSFASTSVPGLAVSAQGPTGLRDWHMARSLASKNGVLGFHESRLQSLTFAEPVINDLEGVGLASAMDAFGASMSELSANPSSLAERLAVLSAANEMTSQFSQTARQLNEGAQSSLDQLRANIDIVNALASEVANLNQQIESAQNATPPPNGLMDQRDALIQEISQYVDVQLVLHKEGSTSVYFGGGRALVDRFHAGALTLNPPLAKAGEEVDLQMITEGGERLNLLTDAGGRLGGGLSAYQDVLLPAINQVDQLAFDLAEAFNAQHQAGFALDGSTGIDFFEPLDGVEGAATNLKLSAGLQGNPELIAASASAEELPGDNGNLLSLIALATEPGATPDGQSFADAWKEITLFVAAAQSASTTAASTEAVAVGQLEEALAALSGVSADEELILLDRAQQSFEASARIIQTADEMMQTALNLKR